MRAELFKCAQIHYDTTRSLKPICFIQSHLSEESPHVHCSRLNKHKFIVSKVRVRVIPEKGNEHINNK